jgi:ketosteroid isomerase-like protein
MRSARELWEAVYEAVDATDDAALRRLCADGVEIQTASRLHHGAQKLADLFAEQRSLHADLQRKVDGVIESADGLAMSAELTLSGVPRGTDKRLTWAVVETIRVEQDRVVSWHAMLDRTWLIQQVKANQR